jgi:putative NADPH-quinone reductase
LPKRILILIGHPDRSPAHLGHALAEAYAAGAAESGHEVRRIDIAALDFPVLRSREEWEHAAPPPDIAKAQDSLRWADHIFMVYPLWLGDVPALLKAFLEQVFRPSFAFGVDGASKQKPMRGKSARIVVTMGMPALLYRWYFGAHSLKSVKRSIFGLCGMAPVRTSVLGMIESGKALRREKWLRTMRLCGRYAV